MRPSKLLLKLNLSLDSVASSAIWKVSLPLLFLALTVYVLSRPMQANRIGFLSDAAFASWSANKAAKGSDVAQSNVCFPPPAGLVSWWPGEGNANDLRERNHGTLRNGASFAPGQVRQAFSFDGMDDFVNVPDASSLTLGAAPFTIDLWINFNQLKGRDPFIGHDEGSGNLNKWIFWFDNRGHGTSGPALRFHINGPAIGPLDTIISPWNPSVGRWYHVAVTRSGMTYALYIDGVQVVTATHATVIPDPTVPLTIGQAEGFSLNGLIDEAEIFNRALSASEIQAIYNAGKAGKCTAAIVSAASFKPPPLAKDSIAAIFGKDLATGTQSASLTPLPTSLARTTVKITDGALTDHPAGLFFVSPDQINFHIPSGTTSGMAGVTITNGSGLVSHGSMQIDAIAPGLFSANADGQGVAAAVAVRVKADGDQIFDPVARFDSAQNKFVSIPIDLGPETEQVFLISFGTGIRFRSSLSAVIVKIGSVDSQVLYAGEAPGFVGLDQVNIRLSRSLIGRGEVDVALTVDGKMANLVRVNIK